MRREKATVYEHTMSKQSHPRMCASTLRANNHSPACRYSVRSESGRVASASTKPLL